MGQPFLLKTVWEKMDVSLSFKPGITGLWQVSGRSEITDFDEVVKLDVAYMDGWTIWRDIQILLKTIKVVVMKDGAK